MSSLATRPAQQNKKNQQSYQHGRSWLTLWAALAFASLLGFSRLSYGLLLPALRLDMQSSYSILGTIATLNFVGYLLGSLAVPMLLARIGSRVQLNLIALLATNAMMIFSSLSFGVWQLGIWRLLIGFASAVGTVLTLALTLEVIHPQERGQASGIIWMGAAIGLTLSGLIAPPIISIGLTGGWRWAWVIMGAVGLVAAIGYTLNRRSIALVTDPEQVQQTTRVPSEAPRLRSTWKIVRPLFLPQRLLWLSLAFFGFGGGYITYFTFFIALLGQQGVPSLYTGFVWAAIGLAAAVSSWFWGRILDRWPSGFTLAISLVLGVFGSLAVLTGIQVVEYTGAALVGLATLLGPPLMMSVLLKRAVPDAEYAISYSTITAIFAVGQMLGPLIGGIIIEQFGLAAGIASSALLLALATLFACGYGLVQRSISA